MSPFSRREFLKSSLAVGAMSSVGTMPAHAAPRTATDMVTLGESGMKVTRLAFGTGTNNGRDYSALGQQEFTRLVHYAYDHGIRFFDTCDTYTTPAMLGEALKGIPRDSYQLMTKLTTNGADPQTHFEQMLRVSQTDYYDIVLLHWQHTPDWATTTANWQEGVLRAQEKKIFRVARRVGTRPARAAPDARQQVDAGGHDPHEPHGHAHGRADGGGWQQS